MLVVLWSETGLMSRPIYIPSPFSSSLNPANASGWAVYVLPAGSRTELQPQCHYV